jgi:hypothetical protein
MDLKLHLGILWRFRWVLVAGVLVAGAVAFLSVFKVSSSGIAYRQSETFDATETLFINQPGFPYGWATQPNAVDKTTGLPVATNRFSDPSRYVALASTYSRLANSDPVYRRVRAHGPVNGVYTASAVVDNTNPTAPGQPFINMDALSTDRGYAVTLVRQATNAFVSYIDSQQNAAGIPKEQRVQLQIVHVPKGANLAAGRKYTVPIVLFLVLLIASIALAYVLENIRPRVRPLAAPAPLQSNVEEAPVRAAETSRSA